MSDDYSWNVDRAALTAALSRPPVMPRKPDAPCRCGWRDERVAGPPPREPGPVADLTGCDVALTAASAQRTCHSCGHPIGTGAPCVTHYLGGAAFYRYYHFPACITGVDPNE